MIRWTTFGTLPIKISYFSVQSLQKEKLQYTSLITTDSFFSLRFLMKNNRFETNKENTRVKPYYIMHVDCLKCGFLFLGQLYLQIWRVWGKNKLRTQDYYHN